MTYIILYVIFWIVPYGLIITSIARQLKFDCGLNTF